MLFAATLTTALAVASNVVLFSLANPVTTNVIYKNISDSYLKQLLNHCWKPMPTPLYTMCSLLQQ